MIYLLKMKKMIRKPAKMNGAVIINITDRFKLKNVWKVLTSYGKRSAQTNGIIYPIGKMNVGEPKIIARLHYCGV